ncbi:MAG TPA: alpha/beta hydrolase [Thermoleophilia bacterium]|nr:alpha/beta hydrolase [Thermoleophilia bacterium]
MPYLTVNDVRLHYEIVGGGPTVLLLHPVGLDLTCWESQVRALAPGFRVLRVDLRGHGRSAIPLPPYTLKGFAADVHSLLNQLRLAPAHVIGLSLGGMVAQMLVLEYPSDVRSLVLADTTSTLAPEARRTMIERGEAATRGGMASVIESTLGRWFTPGFMGCEIVARCRERLLADDVQSWAATWRAISELDTEPRLREIRVPSLVIIGEVDLSVPVSRARVMADLIPGARLVVLPGAPHMAPLERPDLFIPPVLEFLREVG